MATTEAPGRGDVMNQNSLAALLPSLLSDIEGKPGFWRDWAEVGGLTPRPRRPLPALGLDLPWYVPMVRHGYSRCEALPLDVVALGTFDVLDTICQPRVEHAEQRAC